MRWFTSDTHFGHARVIELCQRPFKDVDHMNEVMANNWNERVQPDDEVFHLGDVALGRREDTLQIVKRLNGTKFLVPGNHDNCWQGHSRVRPRDRALYTDVGFIVLPRETVMPVAGQVVLACHLPYEGDSQHEARYEDKRPVDEGRWLLCGHVHEAWAQQGRQINVGVDVRDFSPISEDEIGAIINAV